MPSSSQQTTNIATTLAIAILSLFFFTKKFVRAKALPTGPHDPSSSPQPADATAAGGSRRGGGRGLGAGAGAGEGEAVAFAVGLLDIAIPREDRTGGAFPRVMVNDACINRAVREVSRKLVVSLRDADSMPAGAVRAYVSELYQEVYDAACAANRPDLDVRVLLPPSGASGGSGGGANSRLSPSPSSFTFSHGHYDGPLPPTTRAISPEEREFTVDLVNGWATREVAELEPEVEVLFSAEPLGRGEEGRDRVETINTRRRLAGYPALRFFNLESVASKAHKAEYFYAEDVLAEIPTFSSVACGGTFDRLHGGHKKLLTFAASMCAEGRLTVGVTSDSMLRSKSNADMVSSLSERLEGVKDFLRTLNPKMRARVEGITDPFGPPAVEEAFDAIVVSSETVAGAEKINELRAQKGFRPLAVAVTRRMAAATLSSSYLRRAAQQTDREQQQQQ